MRKIVAFIACLASLPAAARPLGVRDVVALTREASLQGKIAGLGPEIAEANVQAALSQYDFNLSAQADHTVDKSAQSNVIFGTESKTTNWNLGASQLTPTGSLISLDFKNQRFSSNSPFFTLNPIYDARVGLGITQPLLRNYFGRATRGNVDAARLSRDAADFRARADLLDLTYRNLISFWNWALQERFYELDREAVALARKTLETGVGKLNVGLLERVDVYAFRADLELRSEELHAVRDQALNFEGLLKNALSLPPGEDLSPSADGGLSVPGGDADDLAARALAEHPVLTAMRKDLEAGDVRVAVKENARLPQLDAAASLAMNGLDSDYGGALDAVGDVNPVWSAGAVFSFPLQNRFARADAKLERLDRRRRLLSLQDAENRILQLVRTGLARLAAQRRRLTAAAGVVAHQKAKWEGEVVRYNQGRSSPDTVLRSQNDYLNARKLLEQARVGTEVAEADLSYALGSFE